MRLADHLATRPAIPLHSNYLLIFSYLVNIFNILKNFRELPSYDKYSQLAE